MKISYLLETHPYPSTGRKSCMITSVAGGDISRPQKILHLGSRVVRIISHQRGGKGGL
jgi:hypothetical protein